MPTVFRIGGFRFFFFSNEGKEPPHIHVDSADKYAKFWIEPVGLAMTIGFNGPELTRLRHLIENNAKLFKEKWNEHFSN